MANKQVMKRFIGKSMRADIEKKTAISVFDRFGKTNNIVQIQYMSAKRAEQEVPIAQDHHTLAEKVNSVKRVQKERVALLSHLKEVCANISEEEIDRVNEAISDLQDSLEDKVVALNLHNCIEDCSETSDGEWESELTKWKIAQLPPVPTTFK